MFVEPWKLRARFARSLSEMYGNEVPAYRTLVEVSHAVNADVVRRHGADAERLGSLDRVTAERHGAIRLGTPRELAQVARIFGAMGMFPVGYYDLRDAAPTPVPVVSTAFRPVDEDELARNPFRVFTSVLATSDRRFFDAALQARLEAFLDARELFGPELLALADRAEADGGLDADDADRFVALATQAFELSRAPVDGPWYRELEAISSVAADIGGVASTHVNHLTPRVLDIDDLYARMQTRGIKMIDAIQGPPRWKGPDVLLRQTSFRALAEPRAFRDADGVVRDTALRVRFGEVEARGIALTRTGRARYDELIGQPVEVWNARLPHTEHGLAAADLAYFTFHATDRPRDEQTPTELAALLAGGWVTAEPIVYEDFLPRSAAGIFQSNLTSAGRHQTGQQHAALDADWMAGVLDRELADPFDLYDAQRERSLDALDVLARS
ncbi:VOC family protein [Solirubrobacter phytolaccae]|uniref:2-oxoadipate dioxygenase/decarboxylase n=1 Tax=Solirubrobacter phytolaccae TaxID=1404360 RepID=A0A9X3SBX9_9ACTN|nr:VOC family protein [Solirubrobacter phytolaccae]MDA0181925.1 VOC family protein [Solirubrobacter phytolaccae]